MTKIFFILLLISLEAHAQLKTDNLRSFFKDHEKLSEKSLEILDKGEVITSTDVEDQTQGEKKTQSMIFYVSGVHPKKCVTVMRKLSLYEQYKTFLPFLERSDYNESTKEINFLLNHDLLPFKMTIRFKIPRITGPGVYDYSFDHGLFNGLKGKIFVVDYKERCLFYTNANWKGESTKIPNLVIEIFSQTLSEISMNKLFRLSGK